MSAFKTLCAGIDALHLNVDVDKLWAYLELLDKWNKAYNLTAVREVQAMVSRHILDSLAVLPWVRGTRTLDVGSGAGLPGIPLAIARPTQAFVLLDSNGKKTRFLSEVKRVLDLSHVEIVQTRIENYRPTEGFDTVTSRAFSELKPFIDSSSRVIRPGGIWLAMKGRPPQEELLSLRFAYQLKTYQVPNLDEERCCVIIEKE